MPSVIHQVIIPFRTSVRAGGRFQSDSFDIDGTESISVNVAVSNPSAAIKRTIFFGPSPNGGFLQARVDTFAAGTNHLLTSLPTHGPRMFIVVDNTGPVSIECEGFLYTVRQVP